MDDSRIHRIAEILYHAEGFADRFDGLAEPPVWVSESLATEHCGDCTGVPASCMRCHAEEFVKLARYVEQRWPA